MSALVPLCVLIVTIRHPSHLLGIFFLSFFKGIGTIFACLLSASLSLSSRGNSSLQSFAVHSLAEMRGKAEAEGRSSFQFLQNSLCNLIFMQQWPGNICHGCTDWQCSAGAFISHWAPHAGTLLLRSTANLTCSGDAWSDRRGCSSAGRCSASRVVPESLHRRRTWNTRWGAALESHDGR